MRSFRAYLASKCSDPVFLARYREQCCICPRTVLVISTIRERGLSHEAVARGAGVELEHLLLLESADRCSFDEVKSLSRFLDLPLHGECRKLNE
jgi:hypothetical protein